MSAVPPPPVDLTKSSLRVLVARQEEVLGPMSSSAAPPRRSRGLAFLGFAALCALAAWVARRRIVRDGRGPFARSVARPVARLFARG